MHDVDDRVLDRLVVLAGVVARVERAGVGLGVLLAREQEALPAAEVREQERVALERVAVAVGLLVDVQPAERVGPLGLGEVLSLPTVAPVALVDVSDGPECLSDSSTPGSGLCGG